MKQSPNKIETPTPTWEFDDAKLKETSHWSAYDTVKGGRSRHLSTFVTVRRRSDTISSVEWTSPSHQSKSRLTSELFSRIWTLCWHVDCRSTAYGRFQSTSPDTCLVCGLRKARDRYPLRNGTIHRWWRIGDTWCCWRSSFLDLCYPILLFLIIDFCLRVIAARQSRGQLVLKLV